MPGGTTGIDQNTEQSKKSGLPVSLTIAEDFTFSNGVSSETVSSYFRSESVPVTSLKDPRDDSNKINSASPSQAAKISLITTESHPPGPEPLCSDPSDSSILDVSSAESTALSLPLCLDEMPIHSSLCVFLDGRSNGPFSLGDELRSSPIRSIGEVGCLDASNKSRCLDDKNVAWDSADGTQAPRLDSIQSTDGSSHDLSLNEFEVSQGGTSTGNLTWTSSMGGEPLEMYAITPPIIASGVTVQTTGLVEPLSNSCSGLTSNTNDYLAIFGKDSDSARAVSADVKGGFGQVAGPFLERAQGAEDNYKLVWSHIQIRLGHKLKSLSVVLWPNHNEGN
jgi:hypothetical protein